jgi:hypothetical protein
MLKRILLALSYLAVAVLIVGVTAALVAVGRGYGYDFAERRVIRNGLVIMGSYPSTANIKIDGKDIGRRTPYRVSLEAGSYDFEVTRDGYRPWHKHLEVLASGVTWAQYILLFPVELKPVVFVPGQVVTALTSTQDHRRFAYLTAGAEPAIWAVGSDGRDPVRVYALRPPTPETGPEAAEELTISEDGSHVLFKSTYAGKAAHILLAAEQGARPLNLTEQFGFNFSAIRFNPNNRRELYWLSAEGLRRLDTENRAATLAIPGQIQEYEFAGDRIIYVQAGEAGNSVWSMDRAGNKQELVQSVAVSGSYDLAYSGFRGGDYLAVIPRNSNTVTVYKDIFSATPKAQVVSKSSSQIRFNEDGRYLAFYSSSEFGTYDIEKDIIHPSNKFDGVMTWFEWFDNYHLLAGSGGKLAIVEYDGANKVEIDGKMPAGMPAFGAPDGRRIIWIGQPAEATQLMTLDVKR